MMVRLATLPERLEIGRAAGLLGLPGSGDNTWSFIF